VCVALQEGVVVGCCGEVSFFFYALRASHSQLPRSAGPAYKLLLNETERLLLISQATSHGAKDRP
jgi:hypothetical protein